MTETAPMTQMTPAAPTASPPPRLPRYTSYPTAPCFHAKIDNQTHSDWLRAIADDGGELSLYVHVPYCDSLCWFCGCNTQVVNRRGPVLEYLKLLSSELALVAAALGPRRHLGHIHFGGGSPTILEPDDVARLFAMIGDHFDIAGNAEIAVEIDPRDLTHDKLEAWIAGGITRASIGVQDFAENVQAAINRHQSFAETAEVVTALREGGVGAINIDLVYGLPFQTVAGFGETLSRILSLLPDRIAIFGYAHVPAFKPHQRLIPTAALPDEATRLAQAELATAAITRMGYRPIGLDHFALPVDPMAMEPNAEERANGRRLRRNFQGYTMERASAIIGVGPSAISDLPAGYVQNISDIKAWSQAISEGHLATAKGIAVTPEDRLRRLVIERLMCDLTVDVGALAEAGAVKPERLAGAWDRLHQLAELGLVICDGLTVTVPPAQRQMIQLAAACFDAYLPPSLDLVALGARLSGIGQQPQRASGA